MILPTDRARLERMQDHSKLRYSRLHYCWSRCAVQSPQAAGRYRTQMDDAQADINALTRVLDAMDRLTWHPIAEAPKDRYIVITDGVCLADVARWLNERPEQVLHGNRILARPEGWFNISRSRIDSPTYFYELPDPPVQETP